MKYRKYRFVSIRGHTIYYGVEPKWILQISPMKNQISSKYRYIESIQLIGINEIISDIKLIHATYLIFAVAVKSESPKIRP